MSSKSKSTKPARPFPATLGPAAAARILAGESWLRIWSQQLTIPISTIARKSGLSLERMRAIEQEIDMPEVAEIEAIATALGTTRAEIEAVQD